MVYFERCISLLFNGPSKYVSLMQRWILITCDTFFTAFFYFIPVFTNTIDYRLPERKEWIPLNSLGSRVLGNAWQRKEICFLCYCFMNLKILSVGGRVERHSSRMGEEFFPVCLRVLLSSIILSHLAWLFTNDRGMDSYN